MVMGTRETRTRETEKNMKKIDEVELIHINNLQGEAKQAEPKVGMGATELMWTDRRPCTIIEVRSATCIVVQADHAQRIDANGMSDMQNYEYTLNPNAPTTVVTRRKNGAWVCKGQPMRSGRRYAIGHREKYHDFSF